MKEKAWAGLMLYGACWPFCFLYCGELKKEKANDISHTANG